MCWWGSRDFETFILWWWEWKMIEIFWKYVVPQKTKQRITVLPSDTCTSNISERLSFNYLYTGIPAMVQCVKDPMLLQLWCELQLWLHMPWVQPKHKKTKTNLNTKFQSSIIHNSWKMDIVQLPINWSIMNKYIIWYTHTTDYYPVIKKMKH